MIKIAKGIASSYLQLYSVIMGERVRKVNEQGSKELSPMGHVWTYSGRTLGPAAGLANPDILERESLTENARDTGVYLQQQFYEAFDNHPQVGELHGMGLVNALEFVTDKTKKQRFDAGWKVCPKVQGGLEQKLAMCYAERDILGFAPPLSIT